MADGVDRLGTRLREMLAPSAEYEQPASIEEVAGILDDLNQRVNRLEAFANRPAVALASAVLLAIAARLGGVV